MITAYILVSSKVLKKNKNSKRTGPSAVSKPFRGGEGTAVNTMDSTPPTCARNTLEAMAFNESAPMTATSMAPSQPGNKKSQSLPIVGTGLSSMVECIVI